MAYTSNNPKEYLSSYVMTYLKEEIKEESLTRDLPCFTRFLESLVIQDLIVLISYKSINLRPYYWYTRDYKEVDLVLYGEDCFKAIEIKSSPKIRDEDLKSLKLFRKDYPIADLILIYGGDETCTIEGIRCLLVYEGLTALFAQ